MRYVSIMCVQNARGWEGREKENGGEGRGGKRTESVGRGERWDHRKKEHEEREERENLCIQINLVV